MIRPRRLKCQTGTRGALKQHTLTRLQRRRLLVLVSQQCLWWCRVPVSQRGVPAVRMSPKVVSLLKSHTRGSAISRATSEPLPDNMSITKDASEFGEFAFGLMHAASNSAGPILCVM